MGVGRTRRPQRLRKTGKENGQKKGAVTVSTIIMLSSDSVRAATADA
jgi:hypothetical protein